MGEYLGDFSVFYHGFLHGVDVLDDDALKTSPVQPSWQTQLLSMPYSILWLSMLCMLFISIYVSIRQAKEILIGYLHGYSMITIIRKFFVPYILISGILFSGTTFLTSYFISDSHHSLYLAYFKTMIPFIGIYLLICLVSVILTWVWVNYRFSSEILKEDRQFGVIFFIVTFLKCGVILTLCIPLLIEGYDVHHRQPYLSVFKENPHFKDARTINFSGLNDPSKPLYRDLTEDIAKYVSNNQIGFADQLDYWFNFLMDNKPNAMGSTTQDPYYQTKYGLVMPKVPYMIVNRKYLLDYAHLDIEEHDEMLLLIPRAYQGTDIEAMLTSQVDTELSFYDEKMTFIPNIETGAEFLEYSGTFINPILIIAPDPLKPDDDFSGSVVDFSETHAIDDLIFDMESKYPTTLHTQSLGSSYHRNLKEQKQSIAVVFQFSIVYLMLIIIFVVTSASMYLSSYANELLVQYMNGFNYWKRYKLVYIITSVVSVIAIGIVGYLLAQKRQLHTNSLGLLFLATFLCDVLVVALMVHLFERKNIPMILKGDL